MVISWYSWVVRVGKFDVVSNYLRDSVTEVVDIYYPFINKEYNSYGKIKVKTVPLFSGYMFLKYEDSPEVYHKIKSHPYITTFVGKCLQEDIDKIEAIKQRENNKEFISKREFAVGDEVLIVNGQFVNFKGKVMELKRDKYIVEVYIFNRKVNVTCSIDDLVSEDGDLFEF